MLELHTTAHDDPDFINIVSYFSDQVIQKHQPETLGFIHINNWFSQRWWRFAGKSLGALGLWPRETRMNLPPFVPNRVLCERFWKRGSGPVPYQSFERDPLHMEMHSDEFHRRRLKLIAPQTTFIWYSGQTQDQQQASLMAYLPVDSGFWGWYLSFTKSENWRLSHAKGISLPQARAFLPKVDAVA